jgi:hypothetical protein
MTTQSGASVAPRAISLVQEAVVFLRNIPKLQGLIGAGILTAAVAGPIGCSDDEFAGCEASRTCRPSGGTSGAGTGGGDSGGGGEETGGTSGSGTSGAGGSSGTAGTGKGGRGGSSSTGGRAGEAGDESGGESGDNAGGEGGSVGPDTRPPTVVSVSPADGAMGVRANTNLVVTFSEPMDRVSTQAAYQSADIPTSGVTFSWNSASTVLTINPNTDLRYADGDNLDVAAQTFAAAITDTAEDRAGNQLASDFDWRFRTLRRIAQVFSGGTLYEIRSGRATPRVGCSTGTNWLFVGDNTNNGGSFLLLAHDISELPVGIVELESATLSAEQDEGGEEGYAALGPLLTYHMAASPPESTTWTTQYLSIIGALSTDAEPGIKSISVLAALADDYAHASERGHLSQYRIGFEQISNANSQAETVPIICNDFNLNNFPLATQYLIP